MKAYIHLAICLTLTLAPFTTSEGHLSATDGPLPTLSATFGATGFYTPEGPSTPGGEANGRVHQEPGDQEQGEHTPMQQELREKQQEQYERILELKESACGGRGCCGFPGMPGIPGSPGHNGIPGMPGNTGEPGAKGSSGSGGTQGLEGRRGSRGPKGDTGPQGPPGLKGERGDPGGRQGDRGETGAAGQPGMKGLRGPRGPPGIQGPANHQLPEELRVAFTVINATRFPTLHSPIVFQTIVSNAGDGYDTDTGKFVCKAAGLYAFTFQFFGGYHNFRPEKASLVKNSEVALTAVSTVDSRLGNFAILDLVGADEVWIEVTESRDFGPSNYNSFTGFRLY